MRCFVWKVKDKVFVLSPQTAASYLLEKIYTPFDQFDQEETWVLLLDTKHKIPTRRWSIGGQSTPQSFALSRFSKQQLLTQFSLATILAPHKCYKSSSFDAKSEKGDG